jgi:hypothetical protein
MYIESGRNLVALVAGEGGGRLVRPEHVLLQPVGVPVRFPALGSILQNFISAENFFISIRLQWPVAKSNYVGSLFLRQFSCFRFLFNHFNNLKSKNQLMI